jgi:hypothetical protein
MVSGLVLHRACEGSPFPGSAKPTIATLTPPHHSTYSVLPDRQLLIEGTGRMVQKLSSQLPINLILTFSRREVANRLLAVTAE